MAGSRMATVPLTLATFNVKDLFDPAFDAKLTELATQLARADADVVALHRDRVGGLTLRRSDRVRQDDQA